MHQQMIMRKQKPFLALLKKKYASGFILLISGSGWFAISGYALYSALKNPDITLPYYDKVPRNEHYFNRQYAGAKLSADPRLPPVRMRHDGRLEFPYDEKVISYHEDDKEPSTKLGKHEQHVNPQGPNTVTRVFSALRMMRSVLR